MERQAGTGGIGRRDDDGQLRADGERIQQLLEELERMAGPSTWERVEELVRRMTTIYGAGLERLLGYATDEGGLSERLRGRLCDDELLSNLLVLHGLHPVPPLDRVQRALDRIRPYLESHAGGVEVLGLEADGTLRLRMVGTCSGCPSSRTTVDHMIQQAIEDAAPEVTRIDAAGAKPPAPKPDPRLVQLHVDGEAVNPRSQWMELGAVDEVAFEGLQSRDVQGISLLLLRRGSALLAYRNRCPACRAPLDQGRLEQDVLECVACGRRFDVARAGRSLEGHAPHLVPIPLLVEAGAARISLPEKKP